MSFGDWEYQKAKRRSQSHAQITHALEDLLKSTSDNRNYWGILISLVVIIGIIGLIALSVVLLTPPLPGEGVTGTRFTLDHIVSGKFDPPPVPGTWISDTEILFRDDHGGLSVIHSRNLSVTHLLSNLTLKLLDVEDFQLSPDRKYLLFRHSFKGDISEYGLHPLASYSIMQINFTHPRVSSRAPVHKLTLGPKDSAHSQFVYATWAPGNAQYIILVHKNDLYLKKSSTADTAIQITASGKTGTIYNGITNFLYKEYILQSTSALWVNTKGSWMCFAEFNDSNVDEIGVPNYSEDYVKMHKLRYPKVDRPNPVVSLKMVQLDKSPTSIVDLKPPLLLSQKEHYLTSVKWIDNETLSVVWMNRPQDKTISVICQPPNWECQTVFVGDRGPNVDIEKFPLLGVNQTSFLVLLTQNIKDSGDFRHIYQGYLNGGQVVPLTPGNYNVIKMLAWDSENSQVYYIGSIQSKPLSRHLWRVSSLEASAPLQEECITCELHHTKPPCDHYTALMASDNFNEILLQCWGPGVPNTILYSLTTKEVLYDIQSNAFLQEATEAMAWPKLNTFKINLQNNINTTIRLMLPPEHQSDDSVLRPLIIRVGSHPEDHYINNKWGADWNTYLVSNKSWVVAEMNLEFPRQHSTKASEKAQGPVEARNYLLALKSMLDSSTFLDKRRIAVWGWGHSATNALHMLAQDQSNLISCVGAVSPITDWSQYVSYYSEQYLGSATVEPGTNFKGYAESSLINYVSDIKKDRTMFVHGTGDENVHYSHMLKMVKELVNSGIALKQQVYTDEDHSLRTVRKHLFTTLDKYIEDCFPPYTHEELNLALGDA
ncbi:unnamed protein product, partial [Meganyctiphanes norvegica]